jgi:hypothetical protein
LWEFAPPDGPFFLPFDTALIIFSSGQKIQEKQVQTQRRRLSIASSGWKVLVLGGIGGRFAADATLGQELLYALRGLGALLSHPTLYASVHV